MTRKIILITGATSGIGEACARLLAKEKPDHQIWITGRRQERLDKLQKEIGARTFCFDIRDKNALLTFVDQNKAELSNLDVLLNNAGLAAGLDPFPTASYDDMEAMIDTNVKGLIFATRALCPFMLSAKSGHIVNIGSVAGHVTYPKGHVYNATKFAVRAFNEALRYDLLGSGIRVTSIDPGMVETEFSLVRFKGDAEKAKQVYTGVRHLTAQDVAESVLWALDRPSHVNVQEILLMPTDQASPRDVHRS